MAYGILIPPPGREPKPLAVKAWTPKPWTSREFPLLKFLHFIFRLCLHTSSLSAEYLYLGAVQVILFSDPFLSISCSVPFNKELRFPGPLALWWPRREMRCLAESLSASLLPPG